MFRQLDYQDRVIAALDTYLDLLKARKVRADRVEALAAQDPDLGLAVPDFTKEAWEAMKAAASTGFSTATDLADWLVQNLKMPFREAHHVSGRIVALAEKKNLVLSELSLMDLQSVHGAIDQSVFKVLSVEASVKSRTSFGGTAPANVKRQAKRWLKILKGKGQ